MFQDDIKSFGAKDDFFKKRPFYRVKPLLVQLEEGSTYIFGQMLSLAQFSAWFFTKQALNFPYFEQKVVDKSDAKTACILF